MDRLEKEPLTLSQKAAYAAPGLSLAVVGVPLYVYIPKFYTDVVGVPIAVLGHIVLAARLLDGILDPAVGYLSDQTRSRLGRRRPYIAVASFILAGQILMLYNPPVGFGTDSATVWFLVGILSLSVAWTFVDVPWEALGPELTFDYHQRTGLFAFRDGVIIAGIIIAAASPGLLAWILNLPENASGERTKFFWFSAIYSPLVIATCLWCAATLRERAAEDTTDRLNPWNGLKRAAQNRPFMILLISYAVAAFGSNLPATLILYYVEHVLESSQAELFLVLYLVTGILFLPGWVVLAKRIGKKAAWLSSMAVNTGAFIGVFFLGPGDEFMYGILVFLSGIGFGATVAIPSAMQADVIDYDEFLTGLRREGQYIGIWSITKKIASAVGIGLALALLGQAGYAPNMEQSDTVRFMLRVLYALLPAGCMVISFFIALAYPISQTRHQAILKAIIARRQGQGRMDDPLISDP